MHEEMPLAWGPDAPDSWGEIPIGDRKRRGNVTSDTCVIDGELYFVRGCLDIPILQTDDHFRWLVWVSVSRKSFKQMRGLRRLIFRQRHDPIFGWLNTTLPYQESTFNLKTNLHWRGPGIRPFVELEPTDHTLAREQREGIRLERAHELASNLLHESSGSGA